MIRRRLRNAESINRCMDVLLHASLRPCCATQSRCHSAQSGGDLVCASGFQRRMPLHPTTLISNDVIATPSRLAVWTAHMAAFGLRTPEIPYCHWTLQDQIRYK